MGQILLQIGGNCYCKLGQLLQNGLVITNQDSYYKPGQLKFIQKLRYAKIGTFSLPTYHM